MSSHSASSLRGPRVHQFSRSKADEPGGAMQRPLTSVSNASGRGGSADLYHAFLMSESHARGSNRGVHALFQEMEDKDGHLFATLQTRKNALLACGWKVVAAKPTGQEQAAARMVDEQLRRLPNLQGALFSLLDAMGKGYAVAELMWSRAGDGSFYIDRIADRTAIDFALAPDGALYYLPSPVNQQAHRHPSPTSAATSLALLPRHGETQVWAPHATAMPARKFLFYAFQGSDCTPYGVPLCAKAYWYYWMKKNTLKFWSIYNEK